MPQTIELKDYIMTAPYERPATGARPAPVPPVRPAASAPSQKVEIIQPYDQFLNRRAEPRFECNDRGCLMFLSRKEVVKCQIINQSASGAQVIFDKVGDIPAEIWLIDLDTNCAKRGTAAWSMPHKMGLKFNMIQQLSADGPLSPKVPEAVYKAWRNMAGLDAQTPPAANVNAPTAATKPPEDDVFFLD